MENTTNQFNAKEILQQQFQALADWNTNNMVEIEQVRANIAIMVKMVNLGIVQDSDVAVDEPKQYRNINDIKA
jgi:hypothetical protein